MMLEWQEEEEPDRVRKRKRKSSKRSRRQCGVTMTNNITNIPPERKNNKRRVGDKYLLVGAPRSQAIIDHDHDRGDICHQG